MFFYSESSTNAMLSSIHITYQKLIASLTLVVKGSFQQTNVASSIYIAVEIRYFFVLFDVGL